VNSHSDARVQGASVLLGDRAGFASQTDGRPTALRVSAGRSGRRRARRFWCCVLDHC
jgi:hypothetical protein